MLELKGKYGIIILTHKRKIQSRIIGRIDYRMEVNDNYYGVLLEYLFGTKKPEIFHIAASGAYRDMASHTLTSSLSAIEKKAARKELEAVKKQWKHNIIKTIIVPEIETLLREPCNDFDSWHKNVCRNMKSLSKKQLEGYGIIFTYGQAQKWINMTLKNMLISGKWKFNDSIISTLHVPVDRYIILAAKDLGVYPPELPWSQWNEDDYISFHKNLDEKLKKLHENKIDWEMRIWSIYKKGLSKRERLEKAYSTTMSF